MSAHEAFRQVGEIRQSGIIVCADHASNHVPHDIDLGISADLLDTHIAIDIGVEGVAEELARSHNMPAHIARISRLVVDLHRHEDDPAVMPLSSDGVAIRGNMDADLETRLARFHRPYHDALSQFIEAAQPELILALHSFTPAMATSDQQRPWQVALLYNQDDRAAKHAIRLFRDEGYTVGDNQPYSGKQLNATMDRHAEARGLPYLTIEVRQDQLTTHKQQRDWAGRIARVARLTIGSTEDKLSAAKHGLRLLKHVMRAKVPP